MWIFPHLAFYAQILSVLFKVLKGLRYKMPIGIVRIALKLSGLEHSYLITATANPVLCYEVFDSNA